MVAYVNVYVAFLLPFCSLHLLCADGEETASSTSDTKLSDVVFIVLSQPDPYHVGRAKKLQAHFRAQMKGWDKADQPKLILSHSYKKWEDERGIWTIFPLIRRWGDDFPDKKWMFVCEDETRIDLNNMGKLIQKYNPTEDWFLGHALQDREATIIHHFTEPSKLTFPDFAGGILLSSPLIKKLAKRWPDDNFRADFAIDPKHELASYILLDDVKLTDVPELCLEEAQADCATSFPVRFPDCPSPLKNEDLFVAVKTCELFHKDRVPVVLGTWAKEAENIEFYSETEDKSIPTIDLGVPNTERGHCGKTLAIMKRAIKEPHIKDKKWLLVADDDTIINIPRLLQLLGCYKDKLVALGERYGYQVAKGYGYDYITGGGGMVFSMEMVGRIARFCPCPADDSPDDMIIGMCLGRMGLPITHSPLFHQARPMDYSAGYLARQIPVSYHKHWNCDPYQVYKELKQYDKAEKGKSGGENKSKENRDEL